MKKHPIDDLFARKLENMSITPSQDTWSRLQGRNQRKRSFNALWQYTSIAATIALLFTMSWVILKQNYASPKGGYIAKRSKSTINKQRSETVQIEKESSESTVTTNLAVEPRSSDQNIASKGKKALMLSKHKPVLNPKPELPLVAHVEDDKEKGSYKGSSMEVGTDNQDSKQLAQIKPIEAAPLSIKAFQSGNMTAIESISKPVDNTLVVVDEPKKRTKVGRILEQLNNVKAGEPIEWHQLGVEPSAIIARASKSIEEGKERVVDSYEKLRLVPFKKNIDK